MVLKGQNYVECNLFLSGIKMAVLAPHSCTAKIDNIAYFPNLQQQDSIPGKDWQRVNFWIRRYGCCYPFKSIIGENCTICQQVTIGGGNSRFPGVPVIGNNVYIAKGSIVMGGITIGNNVTIGANAVVTKPVPDNAIVAGVPAKILRIKE